MAHLSAAAPARPACRAEPIRATPSRAEPRRAVRCRCRSGGTCGAVPVRPQERLCPLLPLMRAARAKPGVEPAHPHTPSHTDTHRHTLTHRHTPPTHTGTDALCPPAPPGRGAGGGRGAAARGLRQPRGSLCPDGPPGPGEPGVLYVPCVPDSPSIGLRARRSSITRAGVPGMGPVPGVGAAGVGGTERAPSPGCTAGSLMTAVTETKGCTCSR